MSSARESASGNPEHARHAITVAVIQLRPKVGEVEENLVHVESLVRDAVREHRPALVVLPESVTSPLIHDPRVASAVRPIDGAPMQLYRQLARELGVVISGGFLAHRAREVRSTYVVAEPDGGVHLHNHDVSGFWGGYYCRGESTTAPVAALTTLAGAPLGTACGWEWAHTDTARRLRYRVQLLSGGMCWPSYPLNGRIPVDRWMRREHARQLQHARELPRQMARLVGAPVALASQAGSTTELTPGTGNLPWRTQLIGESQIVERDGTVLARLGPTDGEGHISATISLAPPEPLDPLPECAWIANLSHTTRLARRVFRAHGAASYQARTLAGRQPWQRWPGADFPEEIAHGDPGEQPVASSGPNAARR